MEKLQQWAADSVHSDCLQRQGKLCVIWQTEKRFEKEFSIGACEKILKNWNDGRDKSNLERR